MKHAYFMKHAGSTGCPFSSTKSDITRRGKQAYNLGTINKRLLYV